jgi:uncharacterized protein YbbC (DUF1343 family)
VLFEATNLSTGRGTDAPFRQVGAPWLDAARVARLMAERFGLRLDTVRFAPSAPGDGKYADTALAGLRFPPFDRRRGDAIRDALRLLRVVAEIHPTEFRADARGLAIRLGIPDVAADPAAPTTWPGAARAFARRVRPYRMY